MITDFEVIAATNKIIKKEYDYPIYLDDVKEGFKTPSFFIQTFTASSVYGKNILRNNTHVIITFFPPHSEKEKVKTGYKVANHLRNVFYVEPLIIGHRKLDCQTISIERAGLDGELFQLELELYYNDYIADDKEDNIEKMNNLYMD